MTELKKPERPNSLKHLDDWFIKDQKNSEVSEFDVVNAAIANMELYFADMDSFPEVSEFDVVNAAIANMELYFADMDSFLSACAGKLEEARKLRLAAYTMLLDEINGDTEDEAEMATQKIDKAEEIENEVIEALKGKETDKT